MRKAIVIALTLVALAAGAACAGPNYYVAMYAAGDTRDSAYVSVSAQYEPYEVWIWILPSDDGLKGFDFKVLTSGDICSSNVDNPDLVTMNSPTSSQGWVGTFSVICHYDWVWVTKLSMVAMSTDPHYLEIVDNPTTYATEASSCLEGFPINELIVYNKFGINTPGEIDAGENSWGAIKALYR